jgi:plastocyanin
MISWDGPAGFTTTCWKIKVGQSVTWTTTASFNTTHPLMNAGGDTPNPIAYSGTDKSVTIPFPKAGTFGFECANHSVMKGAIQVVP